MISSRDAGTKAPPRRVPWRKPFSVSRPPGHFLGRGEQINIVGGAAALRVQSAQQRALKHHGAAVPPFQQPGQFFDAAIIAAITDGVLLRRIFQRVSEFSRQTIEQPLPSQRLVRNTR